MQKHIYQKGLWLVTIGTDVVEIEFYSFITHVDSQQHMDIVLHLSHAHLLLPHGLRSHGCAEPIQPHQMGHPREDIRFRNYHLHCMGCESEQSL